MRMFWEHLPTAVIKRNGIIYPLDCEVKQMSVTVPGKKKDDSTEQKRVYQVRYILDNIPCVSIVSDMTGIDKHGQAYFLIDCQMNCDGIDETLLAGIIDANFGGQTVDAVKALDKPFAMPNIKTLIIIGGIVLLGFIAWKAGWLGFIGKMIPHSAPAITQNVTTNISPGITPGTVAPANITITR